MTLLFSKVSSSLSLCASQPLPVLQGFVTTWYFITFITSYHYVVLHNQTWPLCPVPACRLHCLFWSDFDEFQVWDTAVCELLIGYRLCWGNPCSSALFPTFSRNGADGRTQVLPTHKALCTAGGCCLCRCKNKGQKKNPRSCPAEPRSLLTQPLTDVGVKAKDRKATMPVTDI